MSENLAVVCIFWILYLCSVFIIYQLTKRFIYIRDVENLWEIIDANNSVSSGYCFIRSRRGRTNIFYVLLIVKFESKLHFQLNDVTGTWKCSFYVNESMISPINIIIEFPSSRDKWSLNMMRENQEKKLFNKSTNVAFTIVVFFYFLFIFLLIFNYRLPRLCIYLKMNT